MLIYCKLDSLGQISLKFDLEFLEIIFIQENISEIVVCQNGGHFVQGGDELKCPPSYGWFEYLICCLKPGPRLNIKTVLSTYGDFHVKDKTAVRTSYF